MLEWKIRPFTEEILAELRRLVTARASRAPGSSARRRPAAWALTENEPRAGTPHRAPSFTRCR